MKSYVMAKNSFPAEVTVIDKQTWTVAQLGKKNPPICLLILWNILVSHLPSADKIKTSVEALPSSINGNNFTYLFQTHNSGDGSKFYQADGYDPQSQTNQKCFDISTPITSIWRQPETIDSSQKLSFRNLQTEK